MTRHKSDKSKLCSRSLLNCYAIACSHGLRLQTSADLNFNFTSRTQHVWSLEDGRLGLQPLSPPFRPPTYLLGLGRHGVPFGARKLQVDEPRSRASPATTNVVGALLDLRVQFLLLVVPERRVADEQNVQDDA